MNIAERYMRRTVISRSTTIVRVDIRVGTLPTIYGRGWCYGCERHELLTTLELGLIERAALLDRLVEKPHGLFLATPTARRRVKPPPLSPSPSIRRKEDPDD